MTPPESRDTDFPFWVLGPLGTVVLVLVIYIGCYFLAVRPGAAVWFAPTGMKTLTLPDYRGLPPRIFAPMHYVDRVFIRPQLWGPGRVWTVRNQNGLVINRATLTNRTWNVNPPGTVLPNRTR
jgi:hypothetical protein